MTARTSHTTTLMKAAKPRNPPCRRATRRAPRSPGDIGVAPPLVVLVAAEIERRVAADSRDAPGETRRVAGRARCNRPGSSGSDRASEPPRRWAETGAGRPATVPSPYSRRFALDHGRDRWGRSRRRCRCGWGSGGLLRQGPGLPQHGHGGENRGENLVFHTPKYGSPGERLAGGTGRLFARLNACRNAAAIFR